VMTVPIFRILLLEPDLADLARAGAKPCIIRRGPTTLTSNIAVSLSGSVSRAADEPVTPAWSLAYSWPLNEKAHIIDKEIKVTASELINCRYSLVDRRLRDNIKGEGLLSVRTYKGRGDIPRYRKL
jgi:hypothetical protein